MGCGASKDSTVQFESLKKENEDVSAALRVAFARGTVRETVREAEAAQEIAQNSKELDHATSIPEAEQDEQDVKERLTFCGVEAEIGRDSFAISEGHFRDDLEFGRLVDFLRERFSTKPLRSLCFGQKSSHDCFVTPTGLSKLTDLLKDIGSSITDLSFEGTKLGPEGGKVFSESLTGLTGLVSLNFRGNNLGPEGGETISEALKGLTALTSIELKCNFLGAEGGQAMAEALKGLTGLTLLGIQSNHLKGKGGQAVAEALKGLTALTLLDVGDNDLGPEGGKAISEALKGLTALTSLKIGRNKLGVEGGQAMAEALKGLTGLASLGIQSNDFGVEGGKAIAEALKGMTTLKLLDIGYNDLKLEGGKAIAEALKGLTALTSLDIGSNFLGAEGGQAMAEALKGLTGLTLLGIQNNYLGDKGGKAIAETVKGMTALASLDVGRNKFEVEGGKAIVEALRGLTGLTNFGIEGNNLIDDTLEPLLNALPADIQSLNISKNLFSHLPLSFLRFTKLTDFLAYYNPWKSPPLSEMGSLESTRNFLIEAALGTRRNDSLRVMLVGLGKAGKTSLQRAICSPEEKTEPIHVDDRTEGIEMTEHVTKSGLKMLFWDFAGQEVYYAGHQLFLSDKCVYVLVWNPTQVVSEEEDSTLVRQWLVTIHQHVPNATVLIVGTHASSPHDNDGSVRERIVAQAREVVRELNESTQMELESLEKHLEESRQTLKAKEEDADSDSRAIEAQLRRIKEQGGGAVKMELLEAESVDSVTGVGIAEFKRTLAFACEKHPFPQEKMPTSYKTVLDAVRRAWGRERVCMGKEEAVDLVLRDDTAKSALEERAEKARDFVAKGLLGEQALDVREFVWSSLEFYHRLGEVFMESADVFADVRRILDAVKLLLHHDVGRRFPSLELREQMMAYEETGKLSNELLQKVVWSSAGLAAASHGPLTLALRRFGLLCRCGQEMWLVPSRVPEAGPETEAALAPSEACGSVVYSMFRLPVSLVSMVQGQLEEVSLGTSQEEEELVVFNQTLGRRWMVLSRPGRDAAPCVVVRAESRVGGSGVFGPDVGYPEHRECLWISYRDVGVLRLVCQAIERVLRERFGSTFWVCSVLDGGDSKRQARFLHGIGRGLATHDGEWKSASRGVKLKDVLRFPREDVFLSHCWSDGTSVFAERLFEGLEEHALQVWMDKQQFGKYSDLEVGMSEGIKRSKVVVFCMTPIYLTRPNCIKEVKWALEENRKQQMPLLCLALHPYLEFCNSSKWGTEADETEGGLGAGQRMDMECLAGLQSKMWVSWCRLEPTRSGETGWARGGGMWREGDGRELLRDLVKEIYKRIGERG